MRKKILIIRFSSLGDVILVHPVIRKLSDKGFHVDLLTKRNYSSLFKNNPYIKYIKILEDYKNILQLINQIRTERYFKIIDLHKNLRSTIIKFFFLFRSITYKKYRMRRILFRYFKLNLLKRNNVIKNYLNTLIKLNISYTGKDLEYRVHYKMDNTVRKYLKKNLVIISPFTKYYTKEWPYYKDLLIYLIKYNTVVIIGEKKDYQRIPLKHNRVINLCGKLNLTQITALIDKSKLLISNDSGIMHLGAGTKTPVLSFFGSTVKEFGFQISGKNRIIIENNNISCRPCHFHGRYNCPKKHFQCMRSLELKDVLKYVRKYTKI